MQHFMNKKIYFNSKCLSSGDAASQYSKNQTIKIPESISEEKLSELIDSWMSVSGDWMSEKLSLYTLQGASFEQAIDYLKKKLYYIEAAGGLIEKEKNYLFIFRLGKWDLPKGKLDRGETPKQAAVRECEEECAISGLNIITELSSTFHIYNYRDSYALKRTYWYFMKTDFSGALLPQTEENIEKVEWFNSKEIHEKVFENSYYTIKDVVGEAMERGLIL
jgi:8-oxo-dGTP pyrophosphatase MutT (NUDIX family)